ncbi:MAG TPA: regulatory protein RecX [Candidatus Dormibacteraeota bacterium]|nr:regulatory protein RecX [Candidatus Dormibacteraeota bacterium]
MFAAALRSHRLTASQVVSGRRREGFNEKRERLGNIDDPAVVLEAALRFLEPRQRSIGEVRRQLTRVGYRDDLVERAIARLVELGMLDDQAFARTWIESRDRARPRGERALRMELARKGIERQTTDDVIADREASEPEADAAAAARLLERNARALARVADPRARRNRAYALLARNGFDSETATSSIRAWEQSLS